MFFGKPQKKNQLSLKSREESLDWKDENGKKKAITHAKWKWRKQRKKIAETKERKPRKNPHNQFLFETPKISTIKNGFNHFEKKTIHLKVEWTKKMCQIQIKNLKWEFKTARKWNKENKSPEKKRKCIKTNPTAEKRIRNEAKIVAKWLICLTIIVFFLLLCLCYLYGSLNLNVSLSPFAGVVVGVRSFDLKCIRIFLGFGILSCNNWSATMANDGWWVSGFYFFIVSAILVFV